MRFLGVHYGHNATACLIEDGRVTFCQSEERLNRIKNSTGMPMLTLEHIYNTIAAPDQVDGAVLYQKSLHGYLYLKRHGFKPTQYQDFVQDAYIARSDLTHRVLSTDAGWRLYAAKIARTERDPRLRAEAHAYYANALRLDPERVHYLDHHTAHAYSVVPNVAAWGQALIFTLDAAGDERCATVNRYENGAFTTLSWNDHRNSLGYYYSAVTRVMGMRPGEHEYKIMGLAPYSKRSAYEQITARLERLLEVDGQGMWRSHITPVALSRALQDAFRYERFDNIAGAIQDLTETLVCKWISHWVRETGIRNIGVAGGVFMNVKLSQRVLALPEVERLFVMPSAADESCAIGAANWAAATFDASRPVEPLGPLYLGMEFSDAEAEQAITSAQAADRYSITRPADIDTEVGRLLSEGRIVARCTGRMEFGARALGNRSILANASDHRNVQIINDAIKSRDFWMPFAPSILAEDMARYVVGHDRMPSPYMAITFESTPEAQRDLIAAIHPRDHTLRPQSVSKDWNPGYHTMISEFKRRTGIGGILNTSFNLHGEPVVCSPTEAISTVDRSGLRYLALGGYLLEKVGSTVNN